MTFDAAQADARSASAGVQVDITAPIATVRLAWPTPPEWPTAEAWRALAAVVTSLSLRDRVKAVVLHGTGGRVPAGDAPATRAAAREAQATRAATSQSAPAEPEAMASALRALRGSRHPIVALVEGACLEWELEIATCCDVRVCAESSSLGAAVDAARLEGVYDELRPLAQLLGPTSTLDLVLDGGVLGAERALALGLVNRVAPDGSAAEQAYGLAARVAAGAPLLNRWHKQAVRRLYGQVPLVN